MNKIEVGWGFNPNKNNEIQKTTNCHLGIAALLVADEKEAYNGGCSQSNSGSSRRQKCPTNCAQKSNVGLKAQLTFSLAERKSKQKESNTSRDT